MHANLKDIEKALGEAIEEFKGTRTDLDEAFSEGCKTAFIAGTKCPYGINTEQADAWKLGRDMMQTYVLETAQDEWFYRA